MRTKLQSFKSLYGNKGIIFSLDAVIALMIVVTALTFANFYFIKASESTQANLQIIKVGSDILRILENDGALSTLDNNLIQSKINSMLPITFDMKIRVNSTLGSTETSSIVPDKTFVATGVRIFSINGTYPAIGRYWIWVK